MRTQHPKQAVIKFKTRNTHWYIDEKCLDCMASGELREQFGSSFLNDTAYGSGERNVIITFDLVDVKHFKAEFRKSKIFKNMVSMRFKNNKPNYDEVFEYHMPCQSVNIFGQPYKHERYDSKISFIHKRIKYNVSYCNWCYERLSDLSYDYGHLTRFLYFIVNQSGLFDKQQGNLYWHKHSRSYDKPCKELKERWDYEVIYGDSFNKYYIKTRKTIPELV